VALSAMLKVAPRVPPARGLKVTAIEQLAFTARLEPHVLVPAKSPAFDPEIDTTTLVNVVVPVLDRVTLWLALAVPTFWLAKVSAVALSLTSGDPVLAPVPESETACGEFVALSVIRTDALRVPVAVGLKTTVIEQVPPTATVDGQLFVWL